MLYLIRHGQTDWNVLRKLQGQTDIMLNDNGVSMAQRAYEKYIDYEFDVCFSSPLGRAYETASIFIGDRDIKIIKDDRLKEMSFGAREGETGVIENPENPVYSLFHNPEEYVAIDGAESIEELCARTKAFLDERVMPLLEENKNVLIVGHGAMNCSIISNIHGLPKNQFWKYMTGNCKLLGVTSSEVITPKVDGEPKFIDWNKL